MRRGAIVVLLVLFAACGASARTKALQSSLFALNVARDTTLEVSRKREAQIVGDCSPPDCTLEIGRAKLAAWREKVDPVVEALAKGYRLIASAALTSDAMSAKDAGLAVASALALVGGLR